MEKVYLLLHRYFVEKCISNGKDIFESKLLGFFSSINKCEEAITFYLEQPGFEEYPDDFVIKEVEANIDDFNDIVGEFNGKVFFLSHEWYDGEYDYISYLGYYSDYGTAKKMKEKYSVETEYLRYPEGFVIDKYVIDKRQWEEGFCIED